MKNNKDIIFPYYSGNIRFTKAIGHINLNRFINAIKNPKPETVSIMKQVIEADEAGNKQLKRAIKHKLYSFTPSVLINVNNKRNYDNVIKYTGLMQLDFDKIENKETALDLKNYIFEKKETVCCFISPSGLGVKALISIKTPEDKEHYKAIHKAVVKEYEDISYFDEATNNPMLPLFLSIDRDIFARDLSNCVTFIKEDWTMVKHVNLNREQFTPNFNHSYNEERTLRIFRDKINNINDNGHTQLRSATLILGSRSGAGYIDLQTAINEATRLIEANNYLSKGVKGYISTATWCISEGYKNPLYYK